MKWEGGRRGQIEDRRNSVRPGALAVNRVQGLNRMSARLAEYGQGIRTQNNRIQKKPRSTY